MVAILTEKYDWDAFNSKIDTPLLTAPSLFSLFTENNYLTDDTLVVDVGCGNGRDSNYFASRGYKVIAMDCSHVAIDELGQNVQRSSIPISALKIDFSNLEDLEAATEAVRATMYEKASKNLVYARFCLHAVPEDVQENFFKWVEKILSINDLLVLEFRTDIIDNLFYFGDHYRRGLNLREVEMGLDSRGLRSIYAEESREFAPFRNEFPMIGRIVCQKAI